MQTKSVFRTILTSLTVLSLSSTVVAGTVQIISQGCGGVSKSNQGADVIFYSYEYKSMLSQQEDFFSKIYATKKLHTMSSYLGDLEIHHSAKWTDSPESGLIYGNPFTFANFTAVITSYFHTLVSGYHVFEFYDTVGGASLRIGAGVESCTGFVEKDITGEFAMNST